MIQFGAIVNMRYQLGSEYKSINDLLRQDFRLGEKTFAYLKQNPIDQFDPVETFKGPNNQTNYKASILGGTDSRLDILATNEDTKGLFAVPFNENQFITTTNRIRGSKEPRGLLTVHLNQQDNKFTVTKAEYDGPKQD